MAATTRDRILDAAARVMRERGLANATTRQIAATAGYSEAALYKHFASKTELFVAVLNERVPGEFGALLGGLATRAGAGSVRDTLCEVASAAIDFYASTFPIAASIFSEPQLLAAHRDALRARGAGPQRVNDAIAGYLRAERDLGRIRAQAHPDRVAALLVGACFQRAFLHHLIVELADEHEQFAAGVVDELLAGLRPR
ncbi:TetR/AcrR family transcriptional regulator [Micromonospora sp. WMMD1082]|uniref:TetR/AcrR family transcriptional regulator n=1 Tax=Micromonospora sp. WMMD1082 TaxID=3016104 RepID=UPI002416395E|nr:TetR/AcrR family transcriptional regulator [Micromonospora sp. WMMD1082]MDG4797590.1 helix-turn-helix domain containing protein [Micromonospora sp. WMMD1082]